MPGRRFTLNARISTDNPSALQPALERLFPTGAVTAGDAPNEFRVRTEMEGTSARNLNRHVLSELRRSEKRTRFRSEWTCEGVTERFFDYVPKRMTKA